MSRLRTLFIAVAVLATFLVISPASPASAATSKGGGPGGVVVVKLPGNTTGGGSNGSTPPSGTGSGTGSAPTAYWSISRNFWFPTQPPAVLGAQTGIRVAYNNKCAGGTVYGSYVGVHTDQRGAYTTVQSVDGIMKQTSASYTCWAPPTFETRSVTCPLEIHGYAEGPFMNPSVPSTRFKTFAPAASPFAKSRTLANCNLGWTRTMPATANQFGRYQIVGQGTVTRCTYTAYTSKDPRTGKVPAPSALACRGSYAMAQKVAKWETFCPPPGYTNGRWTNGHSYSPNECLTSPKAGSWTCGLSPTAFPYVAKSRNNTAISIFHDGKPQTMEWRAQPKLTGVTAVKNKRTSLIYKSGTPFRSGFAPDAPTQFFATTPAITSWSSGWQVEGSKPSITGFHGRFFKSGMPSTKTVDKNLALAPQWMFDGSFLVTTVTVSTIDWSAATPAPVVSTKTSRVAMKDAICEGLPTNLAITRARLTN